MQNFAKNKMHYTLAMLGTLFALHPFIEHMTRISFHYMGHDLPILYPTMLMAGLLGLAAFFFASDLTDNRVGGLPKKIGNLCYALAIMVMPCYLGLFVSNQIEDFAVNQGWASTDRMNGPAITGVVLGTWFVLFVGSSAYLRHRISKKDWTSQAEELVDQEIDAIRRAQTLIEMEHYDLAVIQCHKAVIARLRASLTKQGISVNKNEAKHARKLGILNSKNEQYFDTIVFWNARAQTHEPTPKHKAAEVKDATREFLSTIPV
jgi:hypothetical protein